PMWSGAAPLTLGVDETGLTAALGNLSIEGRRAVQSAHVAIAPQPAVYRRIMGARYDAIVVGSGFGGGIAACRLAEAGRSVCLLERGRRFEREDFIDEPGRASELLWHRSVNPGGMFDVR